MPDTPEDESPYDFAPKDETALPELSPVELTPEVEEEKGELAEAAPLEFEKPKPGKSRARRPGMPVPAPADIAKTPLDVPVERTCPHCGFSYFGKPKARCPECAAPAESAVDLLQFSDHGWVRSVGWGLILVALGVAGHVAASAMFWINMRLRGAELHTGAAIWLFLATAIATSRGSDHGKSSGTQRWLARLSALGAVVPWAVLSVFILRYPVAEELEHRQRMIKLLLAAELGLQGLLSVSLGFYAADLARRVPSDALTIHSKTAGWLVGIVCWSLLIIQVFNMTEPSFLQLFMCSIPMVFGFVVILFGAMITLLRLGMEMRHAAHAGESITVRRMERIAAKEAKQRGAKQPKQNSPDLK